MKKRISAARIIAALGLMVLSVSAALGAAPQGPTNLIGMSLGQTEIKLVWTDNSPDETSFRIERSTDGFLSSQLSATVGPDVTSYVDDTVNPDVLYSYRVFAVNMDGDSNPSNVISKYTLDSIAPSAPVLKTPPNGDQLNTHNVRFEWDPVSDMSGVTYRIVVNDLSNGITLHDVSGITSTNISLLLYDANYEWHVSAKDGAGNVGPDSGSFYLEVVAIDHLAPDTVVTAPNGGEILEAGTYFAITWYALDQDFTSTPDLKVRIFFSHNNGDNWEQIAQLNNNPGAFNWHVPNILCDETCLIRVTTENNAQMLGSDDSDFAFSIISASSSATSTATDTGAGATDTNPPNSAPSAPALVFPADGQTGLGTNIACSWNKSFDPEGDAVTYRVHYCTDPTFTNCAPDTVAAGGVPKAFYAYAGLPGLLLMGAVFAAPPSGRKRLMVLLLSLMVIGGTLVACGKGGDEVNVSVPAAPDTLASDELSHRMSGLKAGTIYYWKVVADDGKGGTTESAVRSFATQ